MELEHGHVAVVTGAASGLGRALAEDFATRGLSVVLADVEDEPDQTVSAITVPPFVEFITSMSGSDMAASEAAAIVIQAIETDALHVAPNGTSAAARRRVDRLLADLDER
jgi:NAD(P)-dependent dehydrogenase (short-subunit alcohol dehydrogenase family)